MITSAEARLGRTMAIVAGIGTVASFAIWVGLIGVESSGYDEAWGPVNDFIGLLQSFGFVFTIALGMKLFGADDKPYFRVISQMTLVGAAIATLNSLSATANANSVFETTLNPSEVLAVANVNQIGFFVVVGLWTLTVLRANSDGLVPSWGVMAGRGAGWLILVAQTASFLGLFPAEWFAPLFILGGVILWPIFVIGMSRAFGSKI